MSKAIETLKNLNALAKKSSGMLENRREIKSKMIRTFTLKEANTYLHTDGRTLKKYMQILGINPELYKKDGIPWILDLDQIYALRDALPETTTLKKKFKPFVRQPNQKQQRICIQNQKGGVGKTVTAITFATGAATEYHEGYRCLVVDMDGQATLSAYQPAEGGQPKATIGDLIKLDPSSEDYAEQVREAVGDTTVNNLKIIRAAQVDREVEAEFHDGVADGIITNPYKRLAAVLDVLEDDFDLVFIDTPPSLGYSSINAYYAATSVIFPMGANFNDTDASFQYFTYLPRIYKRLVSMNHGGYDFMKIVLTNYEESNSTLETTAELTNEIGNFLLSSRLNKSEAIRVCSSHRNTVFDLSTSTYAGHTNTFKAAKINFSAALGEVMGHIRTVWNQEG